jgi:hypothetical protein
VCLPKRHTTLAGLTVDAGIQLLYDIHHLVFAFSALPLASICWLVKEFKLTVGSKQIKHVFPEGMENFCLNADHPLESPPLSAIVGHWFPDAWASSLLPLSIRQTVHNLSVLTR